MKSSPDVDAPAVAVVEVRVDDIEEEHPREVAVVVDAEPPSEEELAKQKRREERRLRREMRRAEKEQAASGIRNANMRAFKVFFVTFMLVVVSFVLLDATGIVPLSNPDI